MFEKFKKLDIYLLCLIGITILACFLFAGHYNEMLTDLGREVYYPEQILKGKVLYKDLFNIYGPMSYMLNALWYKIFGIKLETLYFSGSVLALFFVCGIYESAKLFLDKISAFILGIFTFGFLYLWIIPYLFISLTYLYLSFKGEKKFKKVDGLSNKMVIIVFTLIVLFSSMVTFISSPGSFKQMIGIYSGNKVSGTLSYGGIKVNYYVPYDYKINSSTSTSKTYLKNDMILQYSIYLSAADDAIEMDKEIVNEYKNSSIYKSVSDEEFTVRANNKNIRCYKFNTVSLNGNESSTIIAYIPKDKFILTISLLSDKNLNKKEINSFVAMQ